MLFPRRGDDSVSPPVIGVVWLHLQPKPSEQKRLEDQQITANVRAQRNSPDTHPALTLHRCSLQDYCQEIFPQHKHNAAHYWNKWNEITSGDIPPARLNSSALHRHQKVFSTHQRFSVCVCKYVKSPAGDVEYVNADLHELISLSKVISECACWLKTMLMRINETCDFNSSRCALYYWMQKHTHTKQIFCIHESNTHTHNRSGHISHKHSEKQ